MPISCSSVYNLRRCAIELAQYPSIIFLWWYFDLARTDY